MTEALAAVGPAESEKLPCGLSGAHADFLHGNAAQLRDLFGDPAGVGRFATLAPVGRRREVGAIGLDHVARGVDVLRGGLDLARILEGDDAGEGNEVAEGENFARLLKRAAE